MIIKQLNNSSPMSILSGTANKRDYQIVKPPSAGSVNEFCYCDLECEYVSNVFASVGNEDYKNDKSSFIYRRYSDSDTVLMKLFKNGVDLTDLNDNTLGIFYPQITGALPTAESYVAYLLEWEKVYNNYGAGNYQVITTVNQLGTEIEIKSIKFNLMGYSDEAADGTVRIESFQNGNIIGSDFDFTGINWYSSMRIDGKFIETAETFETNEYLTQNYQRKQIQDKIIENYSLETNLLPRSVTEVITKNSVLANKILITDYNLFNEKVLRKIDVRTKEISDKSNYSGIRRSKYVINFSGTSENIIKRNN